MWAGRDLEKATCPLSAAAQTGRPFPPNWVQGSRWMVPPIDDKVRKAEGGREGQGRPWGHYHSQPGLCGLNIPLALCHSARCGAKGTREQLGQEAVSKPGGGLLTHEGQALTEGTERGSASPGGEPPPGSPSSRHCKAVSASTRIMGQTDLRCSDVMAESLVRSPPCAREKGSTVEAKPE